MVDTSTAPPAERTSSPRRRTAWVAGIVAVVLLGATAFALSTRGDDGPKYPVVELAPTNHEVIYEVNGAGIAPVVAWTSGPDNKEQTALDVPLPFKKTLTIPVGPAGGHAGIEARSAQTGAGSLACTMFVDGVQVAQQVSTDGFTGVACSAVIPPTYVK